MYLERYAEERITPPCHKGRTDLACMISQIRLIRIREPGSVAMCTPDVSLKSVSNFSHIHTRARAHYIHTTLFLVAIK